MSGGLVAVHAHPDDETLSTGALLATWAGAGLSVTLVTCTRGEQGEVISTPHATLESDGPALSAHRSTELAQAAAALGVTDRLFLDELGGDGRFVDSGMGWDGIGRARAGAHVPDGAFVSVPVDRAAALLADLLLDRRPTVVVTYEPSGGYGHPDHVQAHRVTMRAVELAVDRGLEAPCVLWAAADADALRTGYGDCVRLVIPGGALSAPDPHGPVPSAAVPAADVDVVVPVAAVLDRVVAALAAHGTQIQAVRTLDRTRDGVSVLGVYALSDNVLQPLLAAESYRCAAGDRGSVGWPQGVLVR